MTWRRVVIDKSLFKRGDAVAVALSGGKDSMCLLHLLLKSKDELGITVKAINVEHGIRGEKSLSDSDFVAKECAILGVPLYFQRVDSLGFSSENGLSVEEAARILRYKVFQSAADEGFCNKIATAHHASDRVETTLFNIFRGASSLGAAGIPESSRNGLIVRPLLSLTRGEIDEYVKENSIPFVTDETNSDNAYSRNYIRNKIIPDIKEKFPSFETAVLRFADSLKDDNDYLLGEARKAIEQRNGEYSFSCDLPKPVFSRAAITCMKSLGILKDYEKVHVDAVLSLKNEENGKSVDLPKGVVAVKDYGRITLYKKKSKEEFCESFKLGTYEFAGRTYRFEKTTYSGQKRSDNRLIADFSKIPDGAVIRNRRLGDTFEKFGGGAKKLKDYLIEKKIPQRERDDLLLLCKGEKVVIICGIEISDAVKVDKDTEFVLQCTSITDKS